MEPLVVEEFSLFFINSGFVPLPLALCTRTSVCDISTTIHWEFVLVSQRKTVLNVVHDIR